jgi:hypothetical protein
MANYAGCHAGWHSATVEQLQPIDFGGERGTRTLDLGIMSATL